MQSTVYTTLTYQHRNTHRTDEQLSMASRVSAVRPHCMSTEGSDVDGVTPLSHLSHEPDNNNACKYLVQLIQRYTLQ